MFPAFVVRSFEFPDATFVEPHAHRSAQLIHSIKGSMVIETDAARWYVPSTRGVWMPPEMRHSIRCFGDVAMKTVFVRPDCVDGMPDVPQEVEITAPLRALLDWLVNVETTDPTVPVVPLLATIKYLAKPLTESALTVPIAVGKSIRPIVDTMLVDPCDRTTLAGWAADLGTSTRTITRQFKRETGLSFSQWRQQVALLHALNLLAAGQTIASVSEDLGYENPGSFIELFKRRFDVTPGRYFG